MVEEYKVPEEIDFNKLKVGIVTLTVGHWDLMTAHFEGLYKTYPHPKEFYIIPNLQYEMSLSAAMNKGLRRALNDRCDIISYCADDVIPGPDSMQTLITKLFDKNLWVCKCDSDNPEVTGYTSGWDFWVAKPELFRNVGFWDESFYPAYFEDNDYDYRIGLKAGDLNFVNEVRDAAVIDFKHLHSMTMKRMNPIQQHNHHKAFETNRERYVRKWGGPPGREVYKVPYNSSIEGYPGI